MGGGFLFFIRPIRFFEYTGYRLFVPICLACTLDDIPNVSECVTVSGLEFPDLPFEQLHVACTGIWSIAQRDI